MRATPRHLAMLTAAAVVAAIPAVGAAPMASAASLPAPQPGAEVYLRPADGVFDVVGGGYGHGIGMSQYGAQGAATKGLNHTQILGFYYPGTTVRPDAPTSIKIGITIDNDGIIQVGGRPGLAIKTGSISTTLPTTPTQWRVRATGTTATTCVVESLTSGKWSAYNSGKTPCPVSFSNPAAGPDKGTVDLFLPSGERRVYRGTIIAHHPGTTKLATVNSLSMQDYLRGVVPSEMPPSWQLEALKSQAVAARTYAATRSKHTSYYDTCDTTSCQVYKGRGKRDAKGNVSLYEWTSTNTAIDQTDRQVLKYGTTLATTMYSSSNGGRTVAVSGYPYLPAKNDPYDGAYASGRPHAWNANLPVASLERTFGIARVERLQVLRRDGSGDWGGRVLSVRVEGFTSSGAYVSKDTSGNGIMSARQWPGSSDGLASNYFTINQKVPNPGTVARISGSDRYATAAEASRAFPAGVDVVYVATGREFPDALAGAARAASNGAPLLLTQPTSVPAPTRDAMARLRPGRVVVLGSAGAISDSVAQTLKSMTTTGNLQRVGGKDRYETAAMLARYYPSGAKVAYVATGVDFPDALAGAALAGRDNAPVLLTKPTSLPPATASALSALRPDRIVVLGSTGAVSAGVASQLAGYTRSRSVTRLAGSDRYGTAAAVAQQFGSATSVYVPSGENFPDALAAAAVAGAAGVPVLLTRGDRLPDPIRAQLTRLRPQAAYILGGPTVVTNTVLGKVRDAIN